MVCSETYIITHSIFIRNYELLTTLWLSESSQRREKRQKECILKMETKRKQEALHLSPTSIS